MVKKCLSFILLISLLFLSLNCFWEKPDRYDSSGVIQVVASYQDVLTDKVMPCDNIPITISTNDYNIPSITALSDSTGYASFENIPYAGYKVRWELVNYSSSDDSVVYIGSDEVVADLDDGDIDSLMATPSTASGLKINEIYTAGPPNNFFYFYDQYFELYNSSEDTIYLDGMIFCRMGSDLLSVTYIYQFPGTPLTGKEYPIGPKEFKVLAQDAINHRDQVFNGEVSIDLSNADFEFVNSDDYGDFDNLDVPNIENIEVGHHLDFMVGLTGDVVLIADGSDLEYVDGIDTLSVIDCVEYSAIEDHIQEISAPFDKGFGGVGQIKYSGQSLERIYPGFDTNNSTLDFEIIDEPTIGYQH